jgi:hypothetical protein
MASEKYQTRLPSDHAERVDQFVDERGISKAEGVRRLILAGLDAAEAEEANGEEPAEGDAPTDEKREYITNLAQLGERVTLAGIVLALLSAIIPVGSALAVSSYGLTVGSFGATAIVGGTMICFIGALLALGVGIAFIGEALIRYGIYTGWFGKLLDDYLGGEAIASAEVAA